MNVAEHNYHLPYKNLNKPAVELAPKQSQLTPLTKAKALNQEQSISEKKEAKNNGSDIN